jgi:hypothetical protein
MKKTEKTNPIGEEQISLWKQKYGSIYGVSVKAEDGRELIGFYKQPDRDILAAMMSLQVKGKVLEANEFLARSTYIGGDDLMKEDDIVTVEACMKLSASIERPDVTVKKY